MAVNIQCFPKILGVQNVKCVNIKRIVFSLFHGRLCSIKIEPKLR